MCALPGKAVRPQNDLYHVSGMLNPGDSLTQDYIQALCVHVCIGPLSLTVEKMSKLQCVDAHVLVDALAYVIGSEEKEFCTPCIVSLALILKTAVSILGSKEKVTDVSTQSISRLYDR